MRGPHEVLVRRHRRRRVEDDRRRHHLGADDRRQDHDVVGRRARRLPGQSRRRLHRRRGSRSSAATSSRATASTRPTDGGQTWTHVGLQRLAGGGPPARAPHARATPCSPPCSASPTTSIRSAASSSPPTAARRWRKTLFRDGKTGAVDLVDRSEEPAGDVRVAVGGVPHAVVDVERRPGQRPVQVERRRRDLDRDHEESGAAGGPVGQGRRIGVAGRRQRASTPSSRTRPPAVSTSATTPAPPGAGERQPQHPPARVLLLAAGRRHQGEGHGLHPQRPVLSSRPTPARPRRTSACRTATTTTCGSRTTTTSGWCRANDGGANVTVNGGQQLDRPGLSRPASSTTCSPPGTCRITSAARSRTTARRASAVRHRPGAGEGSLPPIFYAVGGGESGYIAPDPDRPNVFFAGSYGGFLSRLDRETGQQRAVNIYPNNPMGYSAIDIKERFQWTFPIVFSPLDPKVLYASSQHLWRTTNGGQSWERISPNLTRSDPKTLQASGGPITRDQTGVETYAVIFTIAPSRQDASTIWTGSDDGWVHVTRDGAKTWTKVTPPDLPEFTRIGLIEASPHQNGVAYLAGEPLSTRRSPALPLQDRRLRSDVDADRHRHPRRRLPARRPRGSGRAAGCSTPAPSTASTCRSTTAPTGSRCS